MKKYIGIIIGIVIIVVTTIILIAVGLLSQNNVETKHILNKSKTVDGVYIEAVEESTYSTGFKVLLKNLTNEEKWVPVNGGTSSGPYYVERLENDNWIVIPISKAVSFGETYCKIGINPNEERIYSNSLQDIYYSEDLTPGIYRFRSDVAIYDMLEFEIKE